jgi:type III secretion protein L
MPGSEQEPPIPVTRTWIPGEVFQARREADDILAAARAQAEEILAAARTEAAREVAAARVATAEAREAATRLLTTAREEQASAAARGHAEGLDRAAARATACVAAACAEAERLRSRQRPELLRLALRIAARILGREVELRPETTAEVAAEVLREAHPQGQVVLRVHPRDLELMQAARPRLLGLLRVAEEGEPAAADTGSGGPGAAQQPGSWPLLGLRADPSVGRGGCVLETEAGELDARLETQLALLERTLLAKEP